MRRAIAVITSVVLIVLAGAVGAAPAHAVVGSGYTAGPIAYSTITDCGSIIWGSPSQSYGVGAYAGAYVDTDNSVPRIDQPFYIQLTIGGIGNSCSGQFFVPGFTLPDGLRLDTGNDVLCYYEGVQQAQSLCPARNYLGSRQDFLYPAADNSDGVFGIPQGRTWVFRFPVVASKSFTGQDVTGRVVMADGNGNPTLRPKGPVYVFDGTATGDPGGANYRFVFASPSTVAMPTSLHGIYSEGIVYTNNVAGTVFLARTGGTGGNPDSWNDRLSFPVPADEGWRVHSDWEEHGVTPGKHYRWAIGFRATGGSKITWGDIQRFTGLSQTTCSGQGITVSLALGQLPTASSDVILGTGGKDSIAAGDGNDTVCGLGGADLISSGPGGDWIDAGQGDDIVALSDGGDFAAGGPGADTLDFSAATASVQFSLGTTAAQSSPGTGSVTANGFENLIGGSASDTLMGNGDDNVLVGGLGDDTLNGGGGGRDAAGYSAAAGKVTASLALEGPQATGGTGTDTFIGIEDLIGGPKGDVLTGSSGANRIWGGSGGDTISGGKGADKLFGENGDDDLSGGDGDDALSGGSGTDKGDGGAGRDTATGIERRTRIP